MERRAVLLSIAPLAAFLVIGPACSGEQEAAPARVEADARVVANDAAEPALETGARTAQPGPGVEPAEPSDAVEREVEAEAAKKLAERRQAMLEEANAALGETQTALRALDEGEPGEALEALARATGKLELLVARDPELALAPVDVGFVTYDVYGSVEAIEKARDRALALLEDGRVQEARAILSGLASETVIRVTNLPLATYPEAIKAISPLIDDGEVEEAKMALRTALGSVVMTDHVIALPLVRAGHMLAEAQELGNSEEASEEDRVRVQELLAGAQRQLEIAEALGYGTARDHHGFRAQMAEIRRSIGADEGSQGAFAGLRRSLRELERSLFN